MLTQIVAKLKVFHLFWNQLLSAREKVVNEDLYRTQTWDIKKKTTQKYKNFQALEWCLHGGEREGFIGNTSD